MPKVALIDYGSGNLASAAKALARAAGLGPGQEIIVTADPEIVRDAERIVLPGVGAFADCMRGLSAVPGMVEVLREKVLKHGAPFLASASACNCWRRWGRVWRSCRTGLDRRRSGEDHSERPGPQNPPYGLERIEYPAKPHALLNGIDSGAHAYFVHSYQLKPALADDLWRPPIMAARSPQWSAMRISPALSSIRKKARQPASGCWAIF